MRKLVITTLTAWMFLSGVIPSTLMAGSDRRKGTNAGSQLLVPVGARDIALGGSVVAFTSGIEALYWNPAGIARSDHNADIMISWMNYIADIGVNYFAVSGNFAGIGSLAFSLKSFDFGDIPEATVNDPDGTGGTFSPTFFTTGLTFAKKLTDRVFIGATLNLISERIQRVSATGVAVNVGVQYFNFANIRNLNLGVVVKDVGTQMEYNGPGLLRSGTFGEADRGPSYSSITAAAFDLPSTIELGLSYALTMPGKSKLQIGGAFQNNNYSNDEIRLGGEFSFADLANFRGGYTIALDDSLKTVELLDKEEKSFLFGLTFGGGLKLKVTGLDMEIDYAFRQTQRFNPNHIFSLKIGF